MVKIPANACFFREHLIKDLGYRWQTGVTLYVINLLFLFYFQLWGI